MFTNLASIAKQIGHLPLVAVLCFLIAGSAEAQQHSDYYLNRAKADSLARKLGNIEDSTGKQQMGFNVTFTSLANVSEINTSYAVRGIEFGSGRGWHNKLELEHEVSRNFWFAYGIGYNRRQNKLQFDSVSSDLNWEHLSFPIKFCYQGGKDRFYVQSYIGFTLDYLLKMEEGYTFTAPVTATVFVNQTARLSRFDLGLNFGGSLSYKVSPKVYLGASFDVYRGFLDQNNGFIRIIGTREAYELHARNVAFGLHLRYVIKPSGQSEN